MQKRARFIPRQSHSLSFLLEPVTGRIRSLMASSKDWGLIGWAKEIVPVLMDSVSEAVRF